MEKIKQVLALCVTAVMLLSLSPLSVAASDDPNFKLEQLNQQLAVLEQEAKSIQAQMGAYTGEAHVVLGFILSKDPFIVSGSGIGENIFLDTIKGQKQTTYFQIMDPEHGKLGTGLESGLYEGAHRFIGRFYDVKLKANVDIMGAFADEYYSLRQQHDKKMAQIDALKAEIRPIEQQVLAAKTAQQDVLYQYVTDRASNIIFQLNNPYVLSYGQLNMIDKDNPDAKPVALNGATMVPARAVLDAAGGFTYWNAARPERVELSLNPIEIVLTLNSTTAYVNGTPVTMSVPPQIINGKTMIPLRFVSEELGMNVEWIQEGGAIRITHQKDWFARLDQFYTDNGDGTKKFSDQVNGSEYNLPEDCIISTASNAAERTFIEITRPSAHGKLKIYHTNLSTPNLFPVKPLSLTKEMSERFASIDFYRYSQGIYYYIKEFLPPSENDVLVLYIEANSDTPIGDLGDPYAQTDAYKAEIDKNYKLLKEAGDMILSSYTVSSVG